MAEDEVSQDEMGEECAPNTSLTSKQDLVEGVLSEYDSVVDNEWPESEHPEKADGERYWMALW